MSDSTEQSPEKTAVHEELAEAQNAIETLNREVEALKATVAERDEKIAALEAELNAAAAHTLHREPIGEDRLHTVWIASGGQHHQFEAVKRFVESLGI